MKSTGPCFNRGMRYCAQSHKLKGSQTEASFCPAVHHSLSFLVSLPVIVDREEGCNSDSVLLDNLSSMQEGGHPNVSILHGWSHTRKHTLIGLSGVLKFIIFLLTYS